jgi:hypothetical protein
MTQTSKSPEDGRNSSAQGKGESGAGNPAPDQTASTETIRERLEKAISDNPRFKLMKPSGKGFVIGGAKPIL